MSFELIRKVEDKHSARAFGSGTVDVFATPAMIALMEETALKCVETVLDSAQTTVGFQISVKHLKAVGIGETVRSTCTVEETDQRKIVFSVEVTHKGTVVGKGTHTRYVVDKSAFNN